MKLDRMRLVLERAVATGLHVVQRDAFEHVAVGTMAFRDLDEGRDVEFAVLYDLREDGDLERLNLHRNCYIVGRPNEPVPILRVEAELRFDVWRLRSIETTE